MSEITSTMFVIAVNDLMASAVYYRDVLGFTVREIGDDGWRIFQKDSCEIMAGHWADATPARELGDHSYFAYVRMDEVDTYYAQVATNGARILKKPRSEPWGMREFAPQTIDGHRIMFGTKI